MWFNAISNINNVMTSKSLGLICAASREAHTGSLIEFVDLETLPTVHNLFMILDAKLADMGAKIP